MTAQTVTTEAWIIATDRIICTKYLLVQLQLCSRTYDSSNRNRRGTSAHHIMLELKPYARSKRQVMSSVRAHEHPSHPETPLLDLSTPSQNSARINPPIRPRLLQSSALQKHLGKSEHPTTQTLHAGRVQGELLLPPLLLPSTSHDSQTSKTPRATGSERRRDGRSRDGGWGMALTSSSSAPEESSPSSRTLAAGGGGGGGEGAALGFGAAAAEAAVAGRGPDMAGGG